MHSISDNFLASKQVAGEKVHILSTILCISKLSKSGRVVRASVGGGASQGGNTGQGPSFPGSPLCMSIPKPPQASAPPPMGISDPGVSLSASVYTPKALGNCRPEPWDGEVEPERQLLGEDAACTRGTSLKLDSPTLSGLPVWSDPHWVLVCMSGMGSECQRVAVGNKAMAGTEAQRGRPLAQGHTEHLQQS